MICMNKVLFLDDDPKRTKEFRKQHPNSTCVETAQQCIREINTKNWDAIHLDHDLEGKVFVDSSNEKTGMEVIRHILKMDKTKFQNTMFFIHSWNDKAALKMVKDLHEFGLEVYYRPFGLPYDQDRENFVEAIKNPDKLMTNGVYILGENK